MDSNTIINIGSDGGFADGKKAGGLYRNIIAPLAPYAIRGMAWYQGEWNTGGSGFRDKYQSRMQRLIDGWRADWGQGPLPFEIVQLPNFATNDPWQVIREAQRLTRKNVANTGMAITIDLGGGVPGFPDSTELHPRNKKDVGYRLALLALADTYGHKLVAASGPLFKSMSIRNDSAHLVFDYAGSGLIAKGVGLVGFEIATAIDTNFVAASAHIAGTEVVVHKTGAKVTRVRYAWAANPVASLYNKEGLPASPFQTYTSDVVGLLLGAGRPAQGEVRAAPKNWDARGRRLDPGLSASPEIFQRRYRLPPRQMPE